jgi:hypothetical protein
MSYKTTRLFDPEGRGPVEYGLGFEARSKRSTAEARVIGR